MRTLTLLATLLSAAAVAQEHHTGFACTSGETQRSDTQHLFCLEMQSLFLTDDPTATLTPRELRSVTLITHAIFVEPLVPGSSKEFPDGFAIRATYVKPDDPRPYKFSLVCDAADTVPCYKRMVAQINAVIRRKPTNPAH